MYYDNLRWPSTRIPCHCYRSVQATAWCQVLLPYACSCWYPFNIQGQFCLSAIDDFLLKPCSCRPYTRPWEEPIQRRTALQWNHSKAFIEQEDTTEASICLFTLFYDNTCRDGRVYSAYDRVWQVDNYVFTCKSLSRCYHVRNDAFEWYSCSNWLDVIQDFDSGM